MRLALLLLGLAVSCTANAESIDIPLTDLTGNYDSGFQDPNDAPRVRIGTFIIPENVASIDLMHLVVTGSNTNGWRICEYDIGGGQTVLDTIPAVTQMLLLLTAEPLGEGCFFGLVSLPDPAFVDASGLVGHCDVGNPLDPILLLNTMVQAELECTFTDGCDIWLDALTTLSDVRLVLDAQIVAAETRSWGMIKALYR
jgi:hypothetical protein